MSTFHFTSGSSNTKPEGPYHREIACAHRGPLDSLQPWPEQAHLARRSRFACFAEAIEQSWSVCPVLVDEYKNSSEEERKK